MLRKIWKYIIQIVVCRDKASSMLGSKSGFATLVKKKPDVITTHCLIHREALASKTLPIVKMTKVLEKSILTRDPKYFPLFLCIINYSQNFSKMVELQVTLWNMTAHQPLRLGHNPSSSHSVTLISSSPKCKNLQSQTPLDPNPADISHA